MDYPPPLENSCIVNKNEQLQAIKTILASIVSIRRHWYDDHHRAGLRSVPVATSSTQIDYILTVSDRCSKTVYKTGWQILVLFVDTWNDRRSQPTTLNVPTNHVWIQQTA